MNLYVRLVTLEEALTNQQTRWWLGKTLSQGCQAKESTKWLPKPEMCSNTKRFLERNLTFTTRNSRVTLKTVAVSPRKSFFRYKYLFKPCQNEGKLNLAFNHTSIIMKIGENLICKETKVALTSTHVDWECFQMN